MPQVSVIIPTYKHRDYVLETLDSVFAQTFTDYEVIVINDGSPDDTAEVLRPLAKAGRIQYVEQANLGQAAARNRGLSLAKGEFVAFLDDDDLWPPDKLQWQVDALRQNPQAGAVGGACEVMDSHRQTITTCHVGADSIRFESLFRRNPFYSPGQTLIRASAIRAVGGFDLRFPGTDDLDLWFRIARSFAFPARDQAALRYRLHSANASSNLAAMLKNCRRVHRRHLAALPQGDRPRLRQDSDRYLYEYLGHQLRRQMKNGFKSRNFSLALKNMIALGTFLGCLTRTPDVTARLLRELSPRFLFRKLRGAA